VADAAGRPVSAIGRRRALARKEQNASWVGRRRAILAAGADVIRSKGYLAASMGDIAARFGSPPANLYYYVEGKQEIFHALVVQAIRANVELVETAAETAGPAADRLASVIVAIAGSYEEHYPYLHLYVQEDMRRLSESASADDRELSELGARLDHGLDRIVRDGIESGELRADLDPAMARFAILGALNWIHRWFVPGRRLSGKETGEAFREILLRGLLSDPDHD
jgi:TetR/AcrR family transcriptional regulator, cholesterol catabolism regulator